MWNLHFAGRRGNGCECESDTYVGDGQATRFIRVGFTPKHVWIQDVAQAGTIQWDKTHKMTPANGLAAVTTAAEDQGPQILFLEPSVEIVPNGFRVYSVVNNIGERYFWTAWG